MTKRVNGLCVKGFLLKEKVKNSVLDSLKSNKGDGYVGEGVKILISIVIGALLLGGLYLLFKDVILPTVQNKVQGMFNYKG
ncbi:DUF6133 family protein [Paraclostridium sordellii]|uniref:DUF6133 family protein n=1 Tax=Paraclostridium sordellii TaxID=1505 RepID=UPI000E5414AB|nr:DUF6133 family protein [Paeniclostridium sordellii]RGX09350.1 hypothetical protein DWV40_07580 [Paeniclostridium sordellii]